MNDGVANHSTNMFLCNPCKVWKQLLQITSAIYEDSSRPQNRDSSVAFLSAFNYLI